MTTLVVDASVAIKWVVDEDGTDEAMALRRHELVAPDLLVCECANILWKKVRRRELAEAEALLASRLLERADLDIVPTRRLMEGALRLAMALTHPAYDCVYLALAESRDLAFVTADRRLCDRVIACSPHITVLPLSDAGRLIAAAARGKETSSKRRNKKERP